MRIIYAAEPAPDPRYVYSDHREHLSYARHYILLLLFYLFIYIYVKSSSSLFFTSSSPVILSRFSPKVHSYEKPYLPRVVSATRSCVIYDNCEFSPLCARARVYTHVVMYSRAFFFYHIYDVLLIRFVISTAGGNGLIERFARK